MGQNPNLSGKTMFLLAFSLFFFGCSIAPLWFGTNYQVSQVKQVYQNRRSTNSSDGLLQSNQSVSCPRCIIPDVKDVNMSYVAQLHDNNVELEQLKAVVVSLQQTINNYQSPSCPTFSESFDKLINDLKGEQSVLSDAVHELTMSTEKAVADNARFINNAMKDINALKTKQEHISQEQEIKLSEIEVELNNIALKEHQLRQFSTLTTELEGKIQVLEDKIMNELPAKHDNFFSEIKTLYNSAQQSQVHSMSVCNELAAAVEDAVVVCSSVQSDLIVLTDASSSARMAEDVPMADENIIIDQVESQFCFDVPSAENLARSMVAQELSVVKDDLTSFMHKEAEKAVQKQQEMITHAAEVRRREIAEIEAAVAAATSNVLLEHSDDYPTYIASEAQTAAEARSTGNSSIPVMDYALLSAGARVVHAQTSPTYFPAQWRLSSQVRGVASWLGVAGLLPPQAAPSSSSSSSSGGVRAGDGDHAPDLERSVYELLNLHKTLGIPEQALTVDTHKGACWPMQVRMLLQVKVVFPGYF
jgi:hypothetical protein